MFLVTRKIHNPKTRFAFDVYVESVGQGKEYSNNDIKDGVIEVEITT